MNPFSNHEKPYDQQNYSQFILSQIKNIEVGGQSKIDLGGGCIADARMTLRYVAGKYLVGSKFKTKVSKADGSLWVMRDI